MITDIEDWDDDEDYEGNDGDYDCPYCGKEYDEIDFEYQICHHCKFNNNANKEPTGDK